MANRTICGMLDELRKSYETRNFSYMMGLIEEIQMAANRMEASLWDQKDLIYIRDEVTKAKKELKELRSKIKDAKDD